MIWTAWNNGRHHPTGAGYGFKVRREDRDRLFDRTWSKVLVELPGRPALVELNISKASFWDATCRELIGREIGEWLLENGSAPWSQGNPPTFEVEYLGARKFKVKEPPTDKRG